MTVTTTGINPFSADELAKAPGLTIPEDTPVMTNERLLEESIQYIVSSIFLAMRRGGRRIVLYQDDINLASEQMRTCLKGALLKAASPELLAKDGQPGFPAELAQPSEDLIERVISLIETTTEILPEEMRRPGTYGTVYGTFQNYLYERKLEPLPEKSALDKNLILKDPSASHWLKGQIRVMEQRDPVDMLADVEALRSLLSSHVQGMTKGGA